MVVSAISFARIVIRCVLMVASVLVVSCGRPKARSAPQERPSTKLDQAQPSVAYHLVWPATVFRTSQVRDSEGRFRPPWSAVTISVVLPRALNPGDLVAVLPRTKGIGSGVAPVASIREQPAIDEHPATWVVTIQLTDPAFFSAPPQAGRSDEAPFDAVVVYPAARGAELGAGPSATRDLPQATGCSAGTLWAAVDVEPDGRIDSAIFRFCCDRPEVPTAEVGPSPCEYDCQKIFARGPSDGWSLAYESMDD
jgi:hypothetical protein